MIVKVIGLEPHLWRICENGHPYTIDECGGKMEESKCPECNAKIDDPNQALASGS